MRACKNSTCDLATPQSVLNPIMSDRSKDDCAGGVAHPANKITVQKNKDRIIAECLFVDDGILF
jgi:hypothetical protein